MPKKLIAGRAREVQLLWKSVVESAFDFFGRAVDEHDTAPKYAILHLAASVELFMKARLMAEHWTLIVSPKTTPTFDDLKAGNFISVTLNESIERLNGVLAPEEAVAKDVLAEFSDLAKERNKIAHFFHGDLDGDERPRSVIQRQCRVWFHLHRLLSQVWSNAFRDFSKRLDALDRKMREERKFLKTIFENVKAELAKHSESGLPVMQCPVCRLDALTLSDSEQYTSSRCLVCRYQHALLRVQCPECEKDDVLLEHGYDHCPECGYSFTPTEVGDLIGAELLRDEGGHGTQSIYCSDCETDDVFQIDGRYVCLNCMQEWDEISQCEWCSEYNTGDMDNSFFQGCAVCDGHAGYHKDRD